jgi:hypothetical protein
MPSRRGLRPLKAWRYVGVFGAELMVCAAEVRIGPARQSFYAVWDRQHRRLYERTAIGRGPVELAQGTVRILDREVQLELSLHENEGIETVCPAGAGYAWTRKQGGIEARGTIALAGEPRPIESRALIDDTAAYYPRHTRWRWSAGVGTTRNGSAIAWNLVQGVNDPPRNSERTIWVDGRAHEPPPSTFAPDLSTVDGLAFDAEAVRRRRDNLLLVRSDYRQPFGTFRGTLAGGIELAEGYGVMEDHDAWW